APSSFSFPSPARVRTPGSTAGRAFTPRGYGPRSGASRPGVPKQRLGTRATEDERELCRQVRPAAFLTPPFLSYISVSRPASLSPPSDPSRPALAFPGDSHDPRTRAGLRPLSPGPDCDLREHGPEAPAARPRTGPAGPRPLLRPRAGGPGGGPDPLRPQPRARRLARARLRRPHRDAPQRAAGPRGALARRRRDPDRPLQLPGLPARGAVGRR